MLSLNQVVNKSMVEPRKKLTEVKLNGQQYLVIALMTATLGACGGGSSESSHSEDVIRIPVNNISLAALRDTNGEAGQLSGTVRIEASAIDQSSVSKADAISVYWANEQGEKLGSRWLTVNTDTIDKVDTLNNVTIPEGAKALLLYPSNSAGDSAEGSLVRFHDFIGNAQLSGPGGNEMTSWHYGSDRPYISVQRIEQSGGLCIFDNGLVSVTDMANTRDTSWPDSSAPGQANQPDDMAFPAYSFQCDNEPVNTFRELSDEIGVWTYSTLNDAMFYGTVVYDTFLKYLGEPPLEDKIRLRVHYGHSFDVNANWDGAYANFSDGYLSHYSLATLDLIAHEIGHGVLNRISDLNLYEKELSADARTLHEAFGDISGVMAKYEFSGNSNLWIHGEESAGSVRRLDQIITETDAIPSFLDYDQAGGNYYKRTGMITYPFYQLANRWGLETTYMVYLNAAKNCWTAQTTLVEAAECIKQEAELAGLPKDEVVDVFKAVKIKLFEEGVLSHFNVTQTGSRITLSDNSHSTNQVTQWLWDFGDGNTSTDANPEHTYAGVGDYKVILQVQDETNDQDVFERVIAIE